jgi:hypothetical protein
VSKERKKEKDYICIRMDFQKISINFMNVISELTKELESLSLFQEKKTANDHENNKFLLRERGAGSQEQEQAIDSSDEENGAGENDEDEDEDGEDGDGDREEDEEGFSDDEEEQEISDFDDDLETDDSSSKFSSDMRSSIGSFGSLETRQRPGSANSMQYGIAKFVEDEEDGEIMKSPIVPSIFDDGDAVLYFPREGETGKYISIFLRYAF